MRLQKKGLIAGVIASVALVLAGASLLFAQHENGEASNGGCDDFYWESREPGENMMGETNVVTATAPGASANVVISDMIDIPCDGTQQITFNASASANGGAYLQTYIRITCQSGRCMDVGVAPGGMPSAAQPFVQQQLCAPGDNLDMTPQGVVTNNRGMVVLGNSTTFDDFRAGVSQVTFCGAESGKLGQIASGQYRVEVFAYQTNNTGSAAGAGARFDERALSIEMWGQSDCSENGRARRDSDCDRRGRDD